ncbi:unnamed protein product [Owenia fusiformis]|uniref:Uncharacterized protein n=1 Tax=Owenia fusiformis TaxID=6347 RepID=A0A8J1TWK2_OWEFU|nr:unnamed protein product [Owenia fusiformis]
MMNVTDMYNTSETSTNVYEIPTSYYIYTVVSVIILLLICVGNGLTIFIILKYTELQRDTSFLMMSLAVADLIVGLVTSFSIADYYVWGNFPTCLARYVLFTLCSQASVITLVCIAIDRFVAVSYPLHYTTTITRMRLCIMITVTWSISVLTSIILVWWHKPLQELECYFYKIVPMYFLSGVAGGFFIVATATIVGLYAAIFAQAQKQANKIRMLEVTMNPGGKPVDNRANIKSAKVLGIIVGIYLFCWAPLFIVGFCNTPLPNQTETVGVLFTVSGLLASLNSVVNPFIYGWKNKQFRKAYKKVLCG